MSFVSIRSLTTRASSKRLVAVSVQAKRLQSTEAAPSTPTSAPEPTTASSKANVSLLSETETATPSVKTSKLSEATSNKIAELHKKYEGQSQLNILKQLTKGEFEEILNSAPKPTLNRDVLVLESFKKLFQTYVSKSQQEGELSSQSTSKMTQFPNLIPTPEGEPYSAAELAVRQKYHASTSGKLGSRVRNVYHPHQLIINPPTTNQLTVSKLMAAGAHLGHSTKLWNTSTQPFIYGEYNDIHVIDLDKTINYLKRAAKIVEGVAENGGLILYLGLKPGQARSVKEAARRYSKT
ncbi:unnamed protein product [Ambrosiozyma monospora]|uniref:Unnamed protein product n=1 Tax=Ambrosiozyma monospora TaxID=43982 RepID=A0ACB5T841_AMBMO|nr:unnamed protein product [Ambrosiozyma monospora]